MESFHYKKLPSIPYPKGTYLLLHHGVIPASGLVLSDVKIIHGWPNPVLEACRTAETPVMWLQVVDKLSIDGSQRPEFNMGVYQVEGRNYPAAVYGPFEAVHPSQLVRLQGHASVLPEEMKHVAHLY